MSGVEQLAARLAADLDANPPVSRKRARQIEMPSTRRRYRRPAQLARYLVDLARTMAALASADLARAGDRAAIVDELRALARRIEEGAP